MSFLTDAYYWFERGGLVMYPLLLCSILVMAIAFERFFVFRTNLTDSEYIMTGINEKIAGGKWQEAKAFCAGSNNIIAKVLEAGLGYQNDVNSMREAFEEKTLLEASYLRKNLSYLDVIVTMAPLLGLLGTVVGMIGSFKVLDTEGHNPAVITGGVGEALVATAAGLCVAVLALCVYTYFCHKLDYLITDIENACISVVSKARGQ